MTNTLLGLASLIGDAIGAVFRALVVPILEIILKLILTPIINIVLTVTKYALAAVGYIISSFLLKLIDFVEILFRALAGLPAKEGADFSVGLSIDGDQGDILIQLLRNHDIQQAFLSMCIVGLFLLVVTTVFQIIKVEYTTEGAKNAKGPIFQKAFKGAANLMLLPLLVIFGIVFANQLLNLLDKATSVDGDNPTISGLLFVAAASDAHYVKGEVQPKDLKKQDQVVDGAVTLIVLSITDAISESLDIVFGGKQASSASAEYRLTEAERLTVDDKFISQAGNDDATYSDGIVCQGGYKYYNIKQVTAFYNYPSINYILLLFGSVFVLKALFFTCFGMVIRLYKCAILFIISPAVIGMTPINEGGLGKWRTSFIGQVLSAYGTILSINLFFVVIRVLLSIDVTFTMNNTDFGGADANFLGETFMTLILKAIFVMAGVLLIEKFSKELGGYFGAEDAMGAGKDMANQVGDLAMKGVGAAAMVASGGASLAMKAGKAAGGIASKVGGTFSAGRKAALAEGKGGIRGGLSNLVKAPTKAVGNKFKEAGNRLVHKKNEAKAAFSKARFNIKSAHVDNLGAAEQKKEELEKRISAAEKDMADRGFDGNKEELQKSLNKDKRQLKRINKEIDSTKKYYNGKAFEKDIANMDQPGKDQIYVDDTPEKQEARLKKDTARRQRKLSMKSSLEGLADMGRKNLPFRKYYDQFDKSAAAGAKILGPQFESAVGSVDYAKTKEKQDLNEKSAKKDLDAINRNAAFLLSLQATKELGTHMSQMTKEIVRELQNIANMEKMGVDKSVTDSRKASLLQNMQQQGSSINAQGLKLLMDKVQMDQKIEFSDLKIDFDPKKIEKAVMQAMQSASNPDDVRKAIVDELKKVGLDGNANLVKMISDLFEKHIGNLKK